jgi:DNA-binding transcriptional ArsR family regulator
MPPGVQAAIELTARRILDIRLYVENYRHMDSSAAILALAALAQPTRLDVFRKLVTREPGGLAAGDIAKELAVPHNTMSSHLSILERALLVSSQRQGRSIVYRANLATLQSMTLFLLQDCCGGEPALCASLIESIKPCCPPSKESTHGNAKAGSRV